MNSTITINVTGNDDEGYTAVAEGTDRLARIIGLDPDHTPRPFRSTAETPELAVWELVQQIGESQAWPGGRP